MATHRNTAIRVEGVAKQYRIGSAPTSSYRTLRESIGGAFHSGVRQLGRLRGRLGGANGSSESRPRSDEFWALKDVSFDVKPGEVIGIIGRNGAGKSTLLKILSRIAEPTRGRVEVRGRMGSLLEVGTGFHPELTGRENIYLNGAILGMSRREIARKFDAIVDFAEIERFLDTPVKRYSSGMYVRLAFAVASHLEPEILIVDEVLAVGDAQFQRKCLGRMGEVGKSGRTVLFVSHNMAAIRALCSRCLLMDQGAMIADGSTDDVVDSHYRSDFKSSTVTDLRLRRHRISNEKAEFTCVSLLDSQGMPTSQCYFKAPVIVSFACEVREHLSDVFFEVGFSTIDGIQITFSTSADASCENMTLRPGIYTCTVKLDVVLLPREYSVTLGLHYSCGTTIDFIHRSHDFTVLPVPANGSDSFRWTKPRGYVRALSIWDVQFSDGSK